MSYCGECGSSLGMDALYTRRCPKCGADVESGSSAAGVVDPELQDNPTRVIVGHLLAGAPQENGGHLPRQRVLPPRRVLWTIGLVAAALLLLAGGTALTISHLGATTHLASTSSRISDGGSGSGRTPGSTASGGPPATANPSQTGAASRSPTAGGSPTAGATGTAGATPGGTASSGPPPTSTPTAAYLSVSPSSISGGLCVSPLTITISNLGGSPLKWTAVANPTSYTVNPPSGTLNPGQSETASVNGLLVSGTVTITAPGAENSPVQVYINCLVG
jgi:hypothetical protein